MSFWPKLEDHLCKKWCCIGFVGRRKKLNRDFQKVFKDLLEGHSISYYTCFLPSSKVRNIIFHRGTEFENNFPDLKLLLPPQPLYPKYHVNLTKLFLKVSEFPGHHKNVNELHNSTHISLICWHFKSTVAYKPQMAFDVILIMLCFVSNEKEKHIERQSFRDILIAVLYIGL